MSTDASASAGGMDAALTWLYSEQRSPRGNAHRAPEADRMTARVLFAVLLTATTCLPGVASGTYGLAQGGDRFLETAGLIAALSFEGVNTGTAAVVDPQLTVEQFWSDHYGNLSGPSRHSGPRVGKYQWDVIAKAQPDECFQGIGNPANLSHALGFFGNYPGDLTDDQKAECLATPVIDYATLEGHAQPKVNQAYVWGLTRHRQELWFGTVANTHCLVISGFLQVTQPSLNSSWVCEGAESVLRDSRPPRAFYYDLQTKTLHEVTGEIRERSQLDAALLLATAGLRSAGSHRGLVLLGGISVRGSVNVFAFNALTKEYLGAMSFDGRDGRPLYNNIRQWRLIDQELYVGVGANQAGEILRWTGDVTSPFEFETVGRIAGDPAYLTPHAGRVYVSSWPSGTSSMGIWMSPELDVQGRLTALDAESWQRVWSIADYEPERSVALSTAGGALMSYRGDLYWGTMHVPGLSLLIWRSLNPEATEDEARAAVLGTYRPISIFRARGLGTPDETIELLYGNERLPRYMPESGWGIVDNNMGQVPKYGLAGFNNFFNSYTWWMEVFDGRLFVGTMDFLYLGAAGLRDQFQFPPIVTSTFERFYGADLWTFSSRRAPATPVSRSGVGNFTNYGVRTMMATQDAVYLGTANPMNLLTDQSDSVPEGGWELIRLERSSAHP
jgi:hypothetical protein